MSGEDLPFPRGTRLPSQSPLFWVGQKDRYLRQLLIRDIEELTGRALLVYFASCAASAPIDDNDEPYLAELLGKCSAVEFDILLETNGGFTDATENVVSTLRNWGKPFRVIVPSRAKSNGTLIALAANSIVMGANSELGPIDPAINDIPCTFIIEAANSGHAVDPLLFQAAHHAIQQTRKLAKSVLSSGMMRGQETRIDKAIEDLSTRDVYHSHGSVIDHREASSLGLDVTYLPPGDPVWERFWLLRCMYAYDAPRNGVAKIFESSSVGLGLNYPSPVANPSP